MAWRKLVGAAADADQTENTKRRKRATFYRAVARGAKLPTDAKKEGNKVRT
jgi:hypothetical protein